MKPLYLDGHGGLEVSLDGPALRVRRPARADGRYPLARISRVVVVGRVRWHPEALSACLGEGKPVAVLDQRGRFVRVWLPTGQRPFGLARHLGELLAVPHFRRGYLQWYQQVERAEMGAALPRLGVSRLVLEPHRVWQKICREQHRRWRVRVGGPYRYLLGLAAAQLASLFSSIGMPRDPGLWTREEYRLFQDLLKLERWHLALLLHGVLSGGARDLRRRELTAAFEGAGLQREVRVDGWRRGALLAMAGVPVGNLRGGVEEGKGPPGPLRSRRSLLWFCRDIPRRKGGRFVSRGTRRSVRLRVRLLRAHFIHSRRSHESLAAT